LEQVRPQGRLSSWGALVRGQAVLAGVGVMVVLFGLVMALVLAADLQPTWWDIGLTHEIQELPDAVGMVLVRISDIGFAPWNWLAPILAVLALWALRWRVEAAFIGLSSAGGFLAEVVKQMVHRPRPVPEFAHISFALQTSSFPSGHVTGYVTFFGFAFYLAFTLLPRSNLIRSVIIVVCAMWVVLVGPSRVYMGQHWASDVLAGYFIGFAWLLFAIEMHRIWLRHHPAKGTTLEESAPGP
jgi:undecaprenyl-diphosphatase